VAQLKDITASTGVSYGLTFKTTRPTKLALLPIGYFDGVSRLLSNRGQVIINGCYAPIVGRICMDIILVDATEITDIKIDDTATIIGTDQDRKITAENLAEQANTINYEILTNWKESIDRSFE
jgi:alanine racemase